MGHNLWLALVLGLLKLSLVVAWDGKLVEDKAFANLAVAKPLVTMVMMMMMIIKTVG